MAFKRHKIGGGHSRKMFSKHANKTHKRNLAPSRSVMRGGQRM